MNISNMLRKDIRDKKESHEYKLSTIRAMFSPLYCLFSADSPFTASLTFFLIFRDGRDTPTFWH